MAEATIYHNPNCSTSKHALAVADEVGIDADVILYLKTKPDAAELGALVDKLEDPVGDLIRKDAFFDGLGLSADDYTTPESVVALLVEHPRLLQRPVIVRGDTAIIGRPKDRVRPFLS